MTNTKFIITTDVVMEQNAASSLAETLEDVVREYLLFSVVENIKELSASYVITAPKTTYKIKFDQMPNDPTDDDWSCIFYCNHGRYTLGHKDATSPWIDDNPDAGVRHDIKYMLNVYMYEHSGITIATTPFGDRWDSGLVGAIYMTEKSINALAIDFGNDTKDPYDYMRSFIKEKEYIINGESWYVEATDKEGKQLDGSFGFLGDITENIYNEFPKEDRAAIEAAWEDRFTN